MTTLVSAIVITALFLYFFIWSLKWRKQQITKWENIGQVDVEEKIEAIVTHVFTQNKRFYLSYWYKEIDLNVYVIGKRKKMKILYQKPLREGHVFPSVHKQDKLLLRGKQRGEIFYAQDIQKLEAG
ncbi:hypothetical protein [Caldalkalibacillus salinus]|uniref:hypothetical protein n=1 Tax=Caldalkalibacillus salinus TaxID=2803787 RepID=UPI0019232683|nr:hypothetical protein [Caldalkalibacillus salinus]